MGHCGGSVAFSFSLLDHIMIETGIIFALLILKQNGSMARSLTQFAAQQNNKEYIKHAYSGSALSSLPMAY